MHNTLGKTVYLRDYKVSDYLIDTVNLEFDLGEVFTLVKSLLKIRVNPVSQNPSKHLILQGEALELVSVSLNDHPFEDYELNEHALILRDIPSEFTLTVITRIKPQENTALSGLYKSSGNFCTQCEAEGFRRITYFLDRPDIMARYTTTIIADREKYPVLLSNGNLICISRRSIRLCRRFFYDTHR
jgi:aminopeptidase N